MAEDKDIKLVPSPLSGRIPPVEGRFSSTRQPKNRGTKRVRYSKIAQAIRDASSESICDRYQPKFIRQLESALCMDIAGTDMTVAEVVALVAEYKALSGDPKMWEHYVNRNEGKVPDHVLTTNVEETTTEEMQRMLRAREEVEERVADEQEDAPA